MVRSCLDSLLQSAAESDEIVLVDNTPLGNLESGWRGDRRVRIVRQQKPGLSRARNTGIVSARHSVIAFVDDDVLVDPGWVGAMRQAFKDDSVEGVTGLVVAAQLSSDAERLFEQYGGMAKGPRARTIVGGELHPQDLIGVQWVGVGANMAFRRRVFERVGMFDEALGAGTVTRGAEDLDFFHRVLTAGMTLRYEPAVRVRHHHRESMSELREQIFANGCAYGVHLMKIWSRRTAARAQVARLAAQWVAGRLGTAMFRTAMGPAPRRRLAWDELRGAAYAPIAYRQAYRRPLKGEIR